MQKQTLRFYCVLMNIIFCAQNTTIPPTKKKIKKKKEKQREKKSYRLCKIKAYVVHLLVTKKGKQVNIYT